MVASLSGSTPRRLGGLARLRLSQFGWAQRAALIAAALIGSAAFAYAAHRASRNALWQVVQACAFDKATTGSPLPCLEVNEGEGGGYVVLRPPFGDPDTILSPTRSISGLEDPQLQAPDAANYFALAWEARRWLGEADPGRVALAVNSRLARSQDQLHVHIGCLSASFAQRLKQAMGPAERQWRRGADWGPGLEVWTYRTASRDWRGLEPFGLLRELIPDQTAIKRATLAVVSNAGEFVVVALPSRPGGWYAAADDILDARC